MVKDGKIVFYSSYCVRHCAVKNYFKEHKLTCRGSKAVELPDDCIHPQEAEAASGHSFFITLAAFGLFLTQPWNRSLFRLRY